MRTDLVRATTAMPIPMPVKAVKNGWANGPKMQRTMKRPTAPPIPPAWPSSPTYAEVRYRMFSVKAKPMPTIPAYTRPSRMPSSSCRR